MYYKHHMGLSKAYKSSALKKIFNNLFCIGVEPINNAVIVSSE